MIKLKKEGFSIAEALVTMLIVALIILMATPVITKRSPKGSGLTGRWECKLNPETGEYQSITTIIDRTTGKEAEPDPANPKQEYGRVAEDGKSCIFTPPKSARNFTVNVIGGGGGGAAGSVAEDYAVKEASAGSWAFVPKYTGLYNIIIIGGGGAGGSTECKYGPAANGALGGAAGGVLVRKNYTLEKGKTYTVIVGAGGIGPMEGFGSNEGHGKPGGDSMIKFPEGGQLVASGGKGGFGGNHKVLSGKECKPTSGWQSQGISGTPMLNKSMQQSLKSTSDARWGGNTAKPGYVCEKNGNNVTCVTNEVKEMLSSFASSYVGAGGYGAVKNDTGGYNGHDGAVLISFSGLYAGGGGKAGTHLYKTFKKLPAEINVRVGAGGIGGLRENEDGKAGQGSAFGNLAVAGGGSGGRIRAVLGPSEPNFYIEGEDGGASPLGGILRGGLYGGTVSMNGLNDVDVNNGYAEISGDIFGAGGGGGASKDKKNCAKNQTGAMKPKSLFEMLCPMTFAALKPMTTEEYPDEWVDSGWAPTIVPPKEEENDLDYTDCWGRGGRGATGLVRVEWN